MTERIKQWEKHYNEVLKNPENFDMEKEKSDFMIHLKFMQHERLIHLIVMMSVLIVTILTAFAASSGQSLLWLIVAILFVTDIFYMQHYYFLENTVQKFYDIYDILKDM